MEKGGESFNCPASNSSHTANPLLQDPNPKVLYLILRGVCVCVFVVGGGWGVLACVCLCVCTQPKQKSISVTLAQGEVARR